MLQHKAAFRKEAAGKKTNKKINNTEYLKLVVICYLLCVCVCRLKAQQSLCCMLF
jgi:hypothetical protein